MVKNRLLLLGSVAFGVSFCLSILVTRDIKTAFRTGLITVPATFLGVAAINRKQRTQQKRTLTALQAQVHRLKKQETHMNQSLLASAAEKQRTQVDLNFLQTELSQLYIQTSEQRSDKQQLNQDLITLREHKRQMEAELHDLETQIQNCEQRRGKLHHSLRSIKTEKQNVEANFNFLPVELKQLQVQIAERQNQKEELERDLAALATINNQLEEKSYNLQTLIREIEQRKIELNNSLSTVAQERQAIEVSLNLIMAQLRELQNEVLEQQINKDKLVQEITFLSKQKYQLEFDTKQIDKLPNEWNEFMMRLPKYELEVLKALTEQVNASAEIKNIAEANITMPELLIDFINQRSLDTIGDLIIEPGNESFPPKIPEEYLTNVKKVIKIKEIN